MSIDRFTTRFSAQRSARRLLESKTAAEGVHFRTFKTDNGQWEWVGIPGEALDALSPIAKAAVIDGDAAVDISQDAGVSAAAKKPAKRKTAPKKAAPKTTAAKAGTSSRGGGGQRRWAEAEKAARSGFMPTPPDFTAPTHKSHRGKLAELIALVKVGSVRRLEAYPIKATSSSPKALDRYRNIAVIALKAKAAKKKG